MIGPIPRLKAHKDTIKSLGNEYARRIETTRADRDKRSQDVWTRALTNYEGHAEQINFPWPNSSNAIVQLTPAHTDAWAARMRNAATNHDPVYLTSEWSAEEIIPGLSARDYAEAYQEYSKWCEKEEVPVDEYMERVTTIFTKYGNAVAYIPFEHEVVNLVKDYDEEGNPVFEQTDVLNRPVVYVFHPRNFYMDVSEEDVQLAQWCGFDQNYDADRIRFMIQTEEWDKEAGEAILKFHKEKTSKEKKKEGGPRNQGYFRRTEDGRELPHYEWEREQQRILRTENVQNHGIPMVRIFARVDINGDGIPEEVEFLLHQETGEVPYIVYHRYMHGKRPLVLFSFLWREGTWMDIGVPEMLFNTQRAMNEVLRDHLNNNKIRNMQMFVARSGGVVSPDTPMFPGKIILAQNPKEDLMAIPLGSSGSSGLTDLEYLRSIAERRDGISDPNLGRERSSRTPATTMLAVLEEGNERVVSIVSRMKKSMEEIATQIHQLYAQRRDADGLDRVVGKEKAELLRTAWKSMDVKDIRKKLILNAFVSTQNLNRAVRRQELVSVSGLLDQSQQKALQIVGALQQTVDPVMRAILITMLRTNEIHIKSILATFDIKEQEEMNPPISEAAKQIAPTPMPVQMPQGGGGGNPQVQQAMGQPPEAGPVNAPGRPMAGLPRGDGGGGNPV